MLSRALPRVAARRAPAMRVQHARCFSEGLDLDFETKIFDKTAYTVREKIALDLSLRFSHMPSCRAPQRSARCGRPGVCPPARAFSRSASRTWSRR